MPLYFYVPFPMGGVLLSVENAPAVDGVEIFVVNLWRFSIGDVNAILSYMKVKYTSFINISVAPHFPPEAEIDL